MLSPSQFSRRLAEELEVKPDQMHMKARFAEDLEFDSLQLLEVVIVIEDLSQELPDEVLLDLATVEDAYAIYVKAVT
jgi:acyl carrier protein